MMDNIKKYIVRRLSRLEKQSEKLKDYNSKQHTFHGGWEKGYSEGQVRVLEDILDMIEEDEESHRFSTEMQNQLRQRIKLLSKGRQL